MAKVHACLRYLQAGQRCILRPIQWTGSLHHKSMATKWTKSSKTAPQTSEVSIIVRRNKNTSTVHGNAWACSAVQGKQHRLSSSCLYHQPVLSPGRQSLCPTVLAGSPHLVRSYVSRKHYQFPEILEQDLEEDFVRGSGPGGQSVNQTANCVVLRHKPSGIVVKCHETRSLEKNRERARERLQERLDLHLHGNKSFLSMQEQETALQRQEKKKRNKARLEMKKAFKEREGLD